MKTIIFYHNDLDGLTSALGYAYNDYINKVTNTTPTYKDLRKHYYFFEVYYGIENIFTLLKKCNIDINRFEEVVIVDYCFTKEIMENFYKLYKEKIIWIDHHKNVITEMNKLKITGIRDTRNSASVLVWKYFKKEPPLFSQYVQDMDLWIWMLPDSKEVLQYLDFLYLQIFDKENKKSDEINTEFIKFFDDDYFKDCLPVFKEYGGFMSKYIEIKAKDDAATGKIIIFEGVKTFVVNSQIKPGYVSEYVFNSPLYEDVEMVFVWYKNYSKKDDEKAFDKISLRTKNIDCSVIAKKYGGNGHPKASAFISEDISKIIAKKN